MPNLTDAQKKQLAQNAAARTAMNPKPLPKSMKPVIAAPPTAPISPLKPVATAKAVGAVLKKAGK